MCVCVCVCEFVYVCVCMCVCMYVCVCVCVVGGLRVALNREEEQKINNIKSAKRGPFGGCCVTVRPHLLLQTSTRTIGYIQQTCER